MYNRHTHTLYIHVEINKRLVASIGNFQIIKKFQIDCECKTTKQKKGKRKNKGGGKKMFIIGVNMKWSCAPILTTRARKRNAFACLTTTLC